MKNRSFLLLIEQQIMILVFVIACAVCIKTFAYSDLISRDNAVRDSAVTAAQNAAQCMKHTGGDIREAAALFGGRVEGDNWIIEYDSSWNESSENAFTLIVTVTEDDGMSGSASVTVFEGDETVYQIPAGWQKEAADE